MLKKANFSIKQAMNKWHHISLNNKFIILKGSIWFSVRFWDNSLLVLKMRFQVFSFASQKIQGFSSDRKTLIIVIGAMSFTVISALWSAKPYLRFLKFKFGEAFIMSLKLTSFSKELWQKAFISQANQIKKIWDTVL